MVAGLQKKKRVGRGERVRARPDPSKLFRVAALFGAGSGDLAIDSVSFVVRAGGEKQFRGEATGRVLASEAQPPEPPDRYRRAILVEERALQFPANRIEGMDPTVAEVADQQAMAERTEVPRCLSNSPGRVEEGAVLEPQQKFSRNIEHVNETKSGAVVLIVGARLPVRECDDDVAAHVLDAERSVIRGQIRIEKAAGHTDSMEVSVKHIDPTSLEVGGVEPRTLRGGR